MDVSDIVNNSIVNEEALIATASDREVAGCR
jgi:hypothetical protein